MGWPDILTSHFVNNFFSNFQIENRNFFLIDLLILIHNALRQGLQENLFHKQFQIFDIILLEIYKTLCLISFLILKLKKNYLFLSFI